MICYGRLRYWTTVNTCIAYITCATAFVIQIPYLFQFNLNENDKYGVFCRFRAFMVLFTSGATVFSYLVQAISRYFTIVLYKCKILLTFRVHAIMVILGWILSLTVSSVLLISPIAYQYELEFGFCIISVKVFHTS